MTSTTEADISAALDGTFRKFDGETGNLMSVAVPRNFVPNHFGKSDTQNAHRARAEKARPWTPELDAVLLDLRAKGYTWGVIGDQVHRGYERCRDRWEKLTEDSK